MSVTQWFHFITNTQAFTHSLITFAECLPWLSTKPGTEKMKISKTSHCLCLHGGTDTDKIIIQIYKLQGSPGVTSGRKSTCQCRRHKRHGFNPWVRKVPLEEGRATHSSILAWRLPMDRGVWGATVHGITQSPIQLKWLSTHTCKLQWWPTSGKDIRCYKNLHWVLSS